MVSASRFTGKAGPQMLGPFLLFMGDIYGVLGSSMSNGVKVAKVNLLWPTKCSKSTFAIIASPSAARLVMFTNVGPGWKFIALEWSEIYGK